MTLYEVIWLYDSSVKILPVTLERTAQKLEQSLRACGTLTPKSLIPKFIILHIYNTHNMSILCCLLTIVLVGEPEGPS